MESALPARFCLDATGRRHRPACTIRVRNQAKSKAMVNLDKVRNIPYSYFNQVEEARHERPAERGKHDHR